MNQRNRFQCQRIFAGAVFVACLVTGTSSHAQDIPAGIDCWSTEDCAADPSIAELLIPADFFGPGSDPFGGPIELEGSSGFIDVQIGRLNDVTFPPGLPAQAMVPIEIVQLDLVSCQPITVTFNGGQNPEAWDVEVDLSQVSVPPGQMTIDKETPNGGRFGFDLPVLPRFTFTKVGDPGEVRVLDTGLEGFPPIVIMTDGQDPWVHDEILDPCPGDSFSPGVRESTCEPPCCDQVPATGPGLTLELRVPGCTQVCQDGCILAGDDAWATPCGASGFDFSTPPIPADFFGPGSDPFDQGVSLGGDGTGADTAIRRLNDMCLDDPPSIATTSIEIVELNLVGCEPITVTFNGGQNPEEWHVAMGLSDVSPPPGQMTVTKTHCNGGTYTSDLFVQPKFIFTRVDNPSDVRVLDTGLEGIPPSRVRSGFNPTEPANWCVDSFFDVDFGPGLFCDGVNPPQCTEVCRTPFGGPPMGLCQIPAVCLPPLCPEDLVPPEGVEQQDLNAVLNRWGDPDCLPGGAAFRCPEDLVAPDGVEQQDLNAVLNRWGDPACEPAPPAPYRGGGRSGSRGKAAAIRGT